MRNYENRLVVILSLGGGVAALDAQAIFYLSPFVQHDLHLNNAAIGVLASAVLLTWSASAYALGALSDRTGRRKPYLAGTFSLFSVFSFLSGLAPSYIPLLLARLAVGVAEGPVIPLSQSIMANASSPHRRGFNMGVVQNLGAQVFGSLIGPLVVVKLASMFSWRVAFYLAGVPGLLIAGAVLLWVREAKPVAAAPAEAARGLGDLAQMLRHRNVAVCLAVSSCLVGWFFLMLTFLPLYCVNVRHMSPGLMSVVLSSMGAAGAVSAIVVPALSDRFGRRPVMTAMGSLSAVAPLAALFVPNVALLAPLVFFGCLGLGIFPLFMGTVPMETVPDRLAARSTGLVMGLGQCVGGFAGPALAGVMADAFGLSTALWLAAGLGLAGGLACWLLIETAPRKAGGRLQAAALAEPLEASRAGRHG